MMVSWLVPAPGDLWPELPDDEPAPEQQVRWEVDQEEEIPEHRHWSGGQEGRRRGVMQEAGGEAGEQVGSQEMVVRG